MTWNMCVIGISLLCVVIWKRAFGQLIKSFRAKMKETVKLVILAFVLHYYVAYVTCTDQFSGSTG